jgi:hypothetical protein
MSGRLDAIRTELRREFDDLAELTAREALTRERYPAIAELAGITSRRAEEHGALQVSVSRLVDRLPEGESRAAARYLWGMNEERDRLSVETRRSAAAQFMAYSSWEAFRASRSYVVLRDRMVDALVQRNGAPGERSWMRKVLRRPRRSVPILALLGVLLGILAMPITAGSVVGSGYREVRSWFANEEAAERAGDLQALDSLRVGMSRAEMRTLLGEPAAERRVRENPFGIVKRTVFYKPGVYAVVALLNDADASVYYSVTALSKTMAVSIPIAGQRSEGGEPRLVSSTLSEIPCEEHVVGFFGASWSNFALLCGGSGAENFAFTVVGWNPYSRASIVAPIVRAEAAAGHSFAGREANPAKAACKAAADRATAAQGAEWRASYREPCRFPPEWTPSETARLNSSREWRAAQKLATVDTYAVTAPNLVDLDSLDLFMLVMNGPGPCRAELEGGSAGCAPWY